LYFEAQRLNIWYGSIKIDFWETGSKNVNWIDLTQAGSGFYYQRAV